MKTSPQLLALPLLIALVWTVPSDALAKRSKCERLTTAIQKHKKFKPTRYVARLARLAKTDKGCASAPNAAFDRLVKDWRGMIPIANKPPKSAAVNRTLARYRGLVAYLEHVMLFRTFKRRHEAMLMLAQLHDAMALYVEQAGTGPKRVFLVKEKGAVYHDKAVDLRELLMLEAERTYAFVVELLVSTNSRSPLRLKAEAGLREVRARLEARRVKLPPPPPPEDEDGPIVIP